MVLHSLSMCLLERVFLSNKSMPCKWDRDRPFGGKVLGPQSRPQSKGRTCGTQQPLAEASISLHCSRTKFLPEVCWPLGDMSPPLGPSLLHWHFGADTIRMCYKEDRSTVLPSALGKKQPQESGWKRQVSHCPSSNTQPLCTFWHRQASESPFPKGSCSSSAKSHPQSLLLTPIALGLPTFSLWKLLEWSICFQPTFHFLLTSESESLPIFLFPCRSDCRCYTTKASLFLQKSTPVQYEVL